VSKESDTKEHPFSQAFCSNQRLQDSDSLLLAIEANIPMNRILFGFLLQCFFLFPVVVIAVVAAGESGNFCFTICLGT